MKWIPFGLNTMTVFIDYVSDDYKHIFGYVKTTEDPGKGYSADVNEVAYDQYFKTLEEAKAWVEKETQLYILKNL